MCVFVCVCPPGGPTNIYIQGLDSVGQLSAELRVLKEDKVSLQQQLEETRRGTSTSPAPLVLTAPSPVVITPPPILTTPPPVLIAPPPVLTS